MLTRKLAQFMDGVDLTGCNEGDVIDLPVSDARLLIAEEWAVYDRRFADDAPAVDRRRPREADRPGDGSGDW